MDINVAGLEEYKQVNSDLRHAIAHTIDLLQKRNEAVNGAMLLGTITQMSASIIEDVLLQVIKEEGEA